MALDGGKKKSSPTGEERRQLGIATRPTYTWFTVSLSGTLLGDHLASGTSEQSEEPGGGASRGTLPVSDS